jgi:hypothetical protein
MHPPSLDVPGHSLPTLRLAAVPDAAPPYDCDTHGGDRPAPGGPSTDPLASAAPAPMAQSGESQGAEAVWARQFAHAIVETLAGTRPFRQVIPSTTERVQDRIGRLIPLLRTDGDARVRRVLVSRTGATVVEVTAIAAFGPRTRALAMRFEQTAARPPAPGLPARPARWLCTDIEMP